MAELADIADTIKRARKKRGISQERAAREVGVQRLQWIRWERGENAPSDENRPKVAALLGIGERSLICTSDEKIDPFTLMIRQTVEREVARALRSYRKTGVLA